MKVMDNRVSKRAVLFKQRQEKLHVHGRILRKVESSRLFV
jgi:hypothetical protein